MKNLKLVSRIALTFTNLDNFDRQINSVLEILGKELVVSRVYIFQDNENGMTTSNVYEWCNEGITQQIDNMQSLPYETYPSWKKLLEKDGRICSSDIHDLPIDIATLLEPQDIYSIIVYPLFRSSRMTGFIGFDQCWQKRVWTEIELQILQTISGIISNVFERNFYHDRIISSENNFRNLFNTIDDLFIIGDKNGRILYTNKSVENKLGYSADELRSMKILDMHPPDKQREAADIIEAMFRGESSFCPLVLMHKNGSRLPVETRVWFGEWDGNECIFGISKDLSKEQEAIQKFTKLFENNPALMAISDIGTKKFTDVNSAFLSRLGYKKSEVIGRSSEELGLFPELHQLDLIKGNLGGNSLIRDQELLVRCKDGSLLNGLFSGEVIENFGQRSYLTVMVDITEQVSLRERVEDQRQKLENIIEGTHLGTWEWNIKTGETVFNKRWAEIAGYTLIELVPLNIETWKNLVHPEDMKKSDELLRKHFMNENEFYECEYRIRHKDGTWVWVLNRGKVIERTTDGKPLRMFGTHMDISSLKKAQAELVESEKRFNLAIAGTQAGLWDWNLITNSIFFSPMWKKMLGYEVNEIENSYEGWQQLWHPEDRDLIEKSISDYLEGKTNSYEVMHRLRHKNGEWRWILARGEILRNETGKPYRWVGTHIDITDEKERSAELERFFSVNLDLLCIADTDGNFIKTNRAWSDILGYSPDELNNRKFLDFVHPDDMNATLEAMTKLSDQEKVLNFVNRYRCRDGSYRHIEWRSHPYGKLIYAAARDISERIMQEEKIREISIRDPLTNIYNRRYIFERMESIISEYRRDGKTFSISILDIDHFKKINDQYGHLAGDFILKQFADIIGRNLRPYDLFGRYGGEEFIVVSMNSRREQAGLMIERILNLVRIKTFNHGNRAISFTFSAGISDSSEFDKNSIDPEKIIEKADNRLYGAKESGRNRIST